MGKRGAVSPDAPVPEEPVRLDIWLWRARFVKTRSLAAQMIEAGRVRLVRPGRDALRVSKPAQPISPGDQLGFVVGSRAVALEVLAMGTRRGPPSEAMTLYRIVESSS